MSQPTDTTIGYFWEYPEYINAWKLAFEDDQSKRFLIMRLLKMLPTSWGNVAFMEDFRDEYLVLLFTHNMDNDEARKNEFQILLPLLETSALKFVGAEGATGRIDMDRFFLFPHQHAVQAGAEYLFRVRDISPLITAAFFSSTKPDIWGIEDPDLYQKTKNSLLQGLPDYWSLINQRAPVLFENLLLEMDDHNCKIAGATITEFNFYEGHHYLSKKQISHVGIKANEYGKTEFGRTVQRMKAPPTPIEKLFQENEAEEQAKLRKQYAGWRKDHNKYVEDARTYNQADELEDAKVEVLQFQNTTVFPSTILKEIRSWAITLLVLGILSIFLSGFLNAPWGVLLIIVGLASFYFRSSAMMVVYGATLAWAGISNLIRGQGFWIGFALLQGIFVFQIFQRFIAFQRAEESWGEQEANSNGLTPQRLASIFPWAASVLGVFSLLGLVGTLDTIMKNQAIPQSLIFLGDLIVNFGVLSFAIGLASLLNKHPRRVVAIIGMVTSFLTLLIGLILRFVQS